MLYTSLNKYISQHLKDAAPKLILHIAHTDKERDPQKSHISLPGPVNTEVQKIFDEVILFESSIFVTEENIAFDFVSDMLLVQFWCIYRIAPINIPSRNRTKLKVVICRVSDSTCASVKVIVLPVLQSLIQLFRCSRIDITYMLRTRTFVLTPRSGPLSEQKAAPSLT